MYFPSKKDSWFTIVMGISSTLLIASMFQMNGHGWLTAIYGVLVVLIIGLELWMWIGTGYKIEDGLIKIRNGPFKSIVKIKEIQKLGATKNFLAGPALSLDRIEILHGIYMKAVVSPKDKNEFIRILISENPDIQVDNSIGQNLEGVDSPVKE